MTQFFINNEILTPPLLAVWRKDEALPPQLTPCADAGGGGCCNESTLPAFVKACHITQGALHSVRHLERSSPTPTPTPTPTLNMNP